MYLIRIILVIPLAYLMLSVILPIIIPWIDEPLSHTIDTFTRLSAIAHYKATGKKSRMYRWYVEDEYTERRRVEFREYLDNLPDCDKKYDYYKAKFKVKEDASLAETER